eukprot:m.256892 g.256892  ORF g.256892 m.256892 type:complete len:368 (+) comp19632_c0_seq35:1684-2787(+)
MPPLSPCSSVEVPSASSPSGGEDTCMHCVAGTLLLTVPAAAVTTLSSVTVAAAAGWATTRIPRRTRFPMPYVSAAHHQPVDAPCKYLSAVYGAFEIAPSAETPSGTVCRQAVPQDPGPNAWTHRRNGWPIALMPSGTNVANSRISVRGKIGPGGVTDTGAPPPVASLRVCGRVPIWGPAECEPVGFSLGVCLSVLENTSAAGQPTYSWLLTEAMNQYNQPPHSPRAHSAARGASCAAHTVLAHGTLAAPEASHGMWWNLTLLFSGTTVTAAVAMVPTNQTLHTAAAGGTYSTQLSSGVAGIGSGWNVAEYDGFEVAPHPGQSTKRCVVTPPCGDHACHYHALITLPLTHLLVINPLRSFTTPSYTLI